MQFHVGQLHKRIVQFSPIGRLDRSGHFRPAHVVVHLRYMRAFNTGKKIRGSRRASTKSKHVRKPRNSPVKLCRQKTTFSVHRTVATQTVVTRRAGFRLLIRQRMFSSMTQGTIENRSNSTKKGEGQSQLSWVVGTDRQPLLYTTHCH